MTPNPRPGEVWKPADFRIRNRRITATTEDGGGNLRTVSHVTIDEHGFAMGPAQIDDASAFWGWALRVKAKPGH